MANYTGWLLGALVIPVYILTNVRITYSAAPKVLSVFNQIDDGIQTNKTNKMKRNERNETKRTTGEDTYAGGGNPPFAQAPPLVRFVSFRSFRFILFVLFV